MTGRTQSQAGAARPGESSDTAAGSACRAGRWRCGVGWLVFLVVAVAVVAAFGAGAI
jgi:hypothetical protein